jgi:hypothetical protein
MRRLLHSMADLKAGVYGIVAVAALACVLASLPLSPVAAQGARMTADRLDQLAAKPTPRLAGHADLNGTWDHLGGIEFVQPRQLSNGSVCITGCGPAPGAAGRGARSGGPPPVAAGTAFPSYRPEFLAKVKDLDERQVQMDSVLRCQAPGVPRIGPPQKIVQSAREVVFFYDDVSGGFFRIVHTDGRPHRKGLSPSYLGDAVGRWDGDTLVVETVNFNEDTWLTDNGAFHTKDLKVTERLRRVGDTIEYQAVAEDPSVLAEPWTLRPQRLWITDQEMEEPARCEDRDLEHVVDGTHHTNPR